MKYLILFLSFFLTGCSGGCEKAKNVVGLESKTTPEDPETAKQRAADEKKLKEQQLKDADALVHKWAEQLQSNASSSGFPRQEGLIEQDPWGNPLRIDYRQEWFDEVVVVRSAGPDGKMDTVDDLTRTRKTSNAGGVLRGISFWGWVAIIWLTTGVLSFLLAAGIGNNRKNHGKSANHKNVLAFALVTILLAPLMFILYGLQFLGGVLGMTGDFFDGFDFDFFD